MQTQLNSRAEAITYQRQTEAIHIAVDNGSYRRPVLIAACNGSLFIRCEDGPTPTWQPVDFAHALGFVEAQSTRVFPEALAWLLHRARDAGYELGDIPHGGQVQTVLDEARAITRENAEAFFSGSKALAEEKLAKRAEGEAYRRRMIADIDASQAAGGDAWKAIHLELSFWENRVGCLL